MVAFPVFALLSVGLTVVAAEQIKYCNGQPYYPSKYTCYNGQLCPVVGGERTLRCGPSCYLPEAYVCKDGKLQQHPPYNGNFAMISRNSNGPSINSKTINASAQAFYIGARTSTYCPAQANICKTFPNTTSLAVSPGSHVGSMNVNVPGGQRLYIAPDGHLAYTQAHSSSIPTGSDVNHFASFQDGYFEYTGGLGWQACPAPQGNGVYQIYARKGQPQIAACFDLNIVTAPAPKGFGAWQYT